MSKLIPGFYINITELCDMKCEYCPKYGENWESTEELLPLEELYAVLKIAADHGLSTFRISGGEPFVYPNRVLGILDTLNKNGITDIVLNTNGSKLAKYAGRLAAFAITKLKVSLDTLDPRLFAEITASSRHKDVVAGIVMAHDLGIPTELNMVVLQKNSADFWPILEFCEARGIAIKLLDLVLYDSFVRNELSPADYWRKEYFDLSKLLPELTTRYGAPRTVYLSNQRGIPMHQFVAAGGCTVTLKCGRQGSTFAQVCRSCNIFPCQEGLFHLSLSAAGNLTPCRLRRDLTRNLRGLSENEVRNVFDEVMSYYQNSFFVDDTVKFSELATTSKI